jgi:hypothetical protein
MQWLMLFVAFHSNGSANTKGKHERTKTRWNVHNSILALQVRFTRLARKLYRVASGGEQEVVDDGASIEN